MTTFSNSPTAPLGRHLRWQVVLAGVGVFLLASLLGYSTYSVTTVLVPDYGGVFREGVVGNPLYFNPLLCDRSDVDEDLCALLYRGLTKLDKNGRVVPDLALEWTISEGKIYTFRLRTDQYWHDGHPITADDVIFTFQILKNPDVLDVPQLTLLWRTVEIEKVDDFTVRFTLSEPYTPFPDYTAMGLLPKHIYDGTPATDLASHPLSGSPIGSGPFMIEEITAEYVRLKPNPYMEGPTPFIPSLELKFYPDNQTLFTAYLKHEVDGISRILPSEWPTAVAQKDLQFFSSVQASYLSIVFNLKNANTPFFADKTVRQALYYGVDRVRLINEVVAGLGIVAHSPMLPENWAYHPNLPQYSYDPGKAREMLQAAGWVDNNGDGIREKDGRNLQFLLYAGNDPLQALLIQQIGRDWEQIGVRAIPTSVTFASLLSDYLAPRRFEAIVTSWQIPGDPDPYPIWHSSQIESGSNYGGWSNKEADEIMQKARAIVVEDERRVLYRRFQEIYTEEVPALLLFYPVYTYAVSNQIKDVQIGSLNRPAERFANFGNWYIVTRRVPVTQAPKNTATPSTTAPGQ